MSRSPNRGSLLPWFGLLVVLAAVLGAVLTRTVVLANDTPDVPAVEAAEGGRAGRWEAFAVSSPRSSFRHDPRELVVAVAPGDRASVSRTADLHPLPDAVLCRFDVSLTKLGAEEVATQVFRLGWDFANTNADENDNRTYAALGLEAAAGLGFRLKDVVGGVSSRRFQGNQAVTWALNNSAEAMRYSAPDGSTESVGSDRMDVWVGRERVFDDVAVIHKEGRISDLKWFWSRGSGTTTFRHFEVRSLERAQGGAALIASSASALVLDPEPLPSESIALGRPTPNPFRESMRYAFAIPGGAAAVDIGIFDLAGRRVRLLAHGVRAPGQYEVRWDGRRDDGARVQNGVYFLRANVGADQRVARVVYLSE